MWLLSENLKVQKTPRVAPRFQMESQDPLKGCAFVNMGHGWKHNFCLSEGSPEHSCSSHRVTLPKIFKREEKAAKWPWLLGERETSLRGAADVGPAGVEVGGGSEVTHRPVLTERFWPRNLRRFGGPCSHRQAWAQSSAVLARVSSHT